MTPLLAASIAVTWWFQLLGAFVGLNTIVYATLAIGKLLPRRRR